MWTVLGPHYEAWKQNNEIPAHGTPLAAWAGITPQEAEILKSFSIPTVEELSVVQDSMMARIPLPNIRSKRDMAQRYLASSDTRKTEQALAEKDQQIADLQAKLENLAELVAEKLDAAEAPKRGPGRPPKQASSE